MNIEEAKERLACYRPGIDDPDDEMFAPALSVAAGDPALTAWLEEQQAFDSALRENLQKADIPGGLLGQLKANAGEPVAKFTDRNDQRSDTDTKIVRTSIWSRVAAAAAAVVLGLLALNSLKSPRHRGRVFPW